MDDITRMARKAGWEMDDSLVLEPEVIWYISQETLERFAELVRADEREQCAKMVEGLFDDPNDAVLEFIVDAIRAGGQA